METNKFFSRAGELTGNVSEEIDTKKETEKSVILNSKNSLVITHHKEYEEVKKNNKYRVYYMPSSGKMISVLLPIIPRGIFYFLDTNGNKVINDIYIEGKNGHWYIRAIGSNYLVYSNEKYSVEVSVEDTCYVKVAKGKVTADIYVESITSENNSFKKYLTYSGMDISIGSGIGNVITLNHRLIDSNQLIIKWEKNKWMINEIGVHKYSFVNGYKWKGNNLEVGDTLFLLGLIVVFGVGFIVINHEHQSVSVNIDKIRPINNSTEIPSFCMVDNFVNEEEVDNLGHEEEYSREPRKRTAFVCKNIVIEGPPMSLNNNSIPLLLSMGSSAVMGGRSLMTGNYTMALSSLLFPMLNQKYTEKQKKEYEELRQKKYSEYLFKKSKEIQAEKQNEERILNLNYPALDKIIEYPVKKHNLWERRKVDDDFLHIRVGHGNIPIFAEINYPEEKFTLDDDNLYDAMYSLATKKVKLENVPIVTSLIDYYVTGIKGKPKYIKSFINKIVVQLAILHSPDELKLVFLAEDNEIKEFEYFKYLPHVWNEGRTLRFVATNTSEAMKLSEFLSMEIENIDRISDYKDQISNKPYYVVFAMNHKILDSMEILKKLMQKQNSCGLSIVASCPEIPHECMQLIELYSDDFNVLNNMQDIEREDLAFKIDKCESNGLNEAVDIISNIKSNNSSGEYTLPKMLTFLDMFGVGKIEHLNIEKRWRDNNPVKSLSAPIGLATDGTQFMLDLHQKNQGPHGLIAGTTGSGKSEFIITYILSMAVNYHPDEVAFVLIDYKGDGLTGAFENREKGIKLPHLVATITNLDGTTIQRAIVALDSELKRRERIFEAAKKTLEEGTMDIYDYQKYYRQGLLSKPMPHLFIISDEFAQLKQQQPEFLDQLVSVARIGRSLGVHLILATQKPSGVVNEQIKSNTKFRVCLKVQDRMDSHDMLGRPEGADIKEPGRFYLQVGNNEYFALGQSGWAGAPYEPQNEIVENVDDTLEFIDSVGQMVYVAKPEVIKESTGKSQLVEIVKTLVEIGKLNNLGNRSLWLDPLNQRIDLTDIPRDNEKHISSIVADLGMIDDPKNQTQYSFSYDLTAGKNLYIAGEPRSGKSTLLQTMVLNLANKYTPEQVNFNILDFSSKELSKLKNLPHCGIVLTDDEIDKLPKLFARLDEIIKKRKEYFSKIDANSFEAAVEEKIIPLIIVMIDGYSVIESTKYGRDIAYKLPDIIKSSALYGIRFVITSNNTNELSSNVKQEMIDRIALARKDRYDYMELLQGVLCDYTPPKNPGRGLCLVDGKPLEIQIAISHAKSDGKERQQLIQKDICELCEKYSGYEKAYTIPTIPDNQTFDEFINLFNNDEFPLGYELDTGKKIALPLKQLNALSVYIGNSKGKAIIINNMIKSALKNGMKLIFVKSKKNSVVEESIDGVIYKSVEEMNELETWMEDYVPEIKQRKTKAWEYCESRGVNKDSKKGIEIGAEYVRENFVPYMLMFEDFGEACATISDEIAVVPIEIFKYMNVRNYKVIAFFCDNNINYVGKHLYTQFNPEGMSLFFGGNHSKQRITVIPSEYNNNNVNNNYNEFVINYRKSWHQMIMPCGGLTDDELLEEDRDIFM